MIVFAAYVYNEYDYCAELVGLYQTKKGAYEQARKKVRERILEQWELWPTGGYRNDYQIYWDVKAIEVIE